MNVLKQITKFFILFSTLFSCFSQNHDLGNVTIQELEEKEHPIEKNASAAVLFDIGRSYFNYSSGDGFKLITEVICKIKIYKKEGYSFANIEVPTYVGGSERELVDFSKAYTYNLLNGKIEKSKLKRDGEFVEKVNKSWNKVKISMPDVKEGSIIEYKYTLTSPHFFNLPVWYFQREIPVNYSKFVTTIPEYFVYNPIVKGYYLPKHSKSSKNYSSVGMGLSFKEVVNNYVAEQLPSMKKEEYIANISDYTSSVEHELRVINFPNAPSQSFSSTWDDVCKNIFRREDFGTELKKTGYFEKEVDALIQNLSTKEEKIIAILNFVKQQVKWNEQYSVYCDQGVKSAYKNKTGNVAEINLMLTAMLRYAGFNANPIAVSSRSNGILLYPSLSSFDYVITGVESKNEVLLLDATDINSSSNILPIRALNREGILIRNDGTNSSVNLLPKFISKESNMALFTVFQNGNLSGEIRIQLFDYNAFIHRVQNSNEIKDTYIESLEKRLSDIEVDDYKVHNDKDLSKQIVEEFKFSHSSLIEIIGDKMYIPSLFFYSITENPFKIENREYPIDFIYPQEKKYNFTINLPEAYVVESIPENLAFAIENNILVYRFSVLSLDNKLQVYASLTINESFILPSYYKDLKDFFKKIVDNHSEKIILKKV